MARNCAENKDAFKKYEYETGVKDAIETEGNRGAYLNVVPQGNYAHFFLCIVWDDMAAVKAYAGNNPQIAFTYPEDDMYELISDPIVIMQKVNDAKNTFI